MNNSSLTGQPATSYTFTPFEKAIGTCAGVVTVLALIPPTRAIAPWVGAGLTAVLYFRWKRQGG